MFTNTFNPLAPTAASTQAMAARGNEVDRFHSQDGFHQAADVCTRVGNTVRPMIQVGTKRSMDNDTLVEFEKIPTAKRARLHRKIKAGVVREAMRKEAPILAAAGTAWCYRDRIMGSSLFNSAKQLVQSIPSGVQFGLSGQMLAMGASVRKEVMSRISQLKDNVRFVLDLSDNTPAHLKNIVDFHALKTLFEEHGDKLPLEVRAEITGKLATIASFIGRSGGEYNYETFNSKEPIRYGRQIF